METEQIQAITFDAAGTLIHLVEPVGSSYAKVASEHGILADAEALQSAFGAVWKRTPLAFSEESHVADRNEKDWWKRIVREVFEEAGSELPDRERFAIFFEALYAHFESPGTWSLDPAAREVVATTGQHFRIAVLSNFDARLRRILQDLNLFAPFEACILSCEVGASKPDPKIFSAAADALSLAPAKILHVGDDPTCDWQGAQAAGFQHFRVGERGNPLRALIDELSLA